jgi:hypothetical protein
MSLRAPNTPALPDPLAERVRRNHDECIRELQQLPSATLHVVKNVSLVDGVETTVAHKLGRLPDFVQVSVPRGATTNGSVDEIRDGTHDRAKVIVLLASGYTTTVLVDVVVI